MTRYLLMMVMVILTPPKGSGGMPLAPKPALIEAMGMMSENIERANRGESLAYTEEAFNKVVMNNGIDYNSVMSRSWI